MLGASFFAGAYFGGIDTNDAPPAPTVAFIQPGLLQFDAPFRLDHGGHPVMVEQDSPQEIGAAIYNILVCEQGAKLNDPGFGRVAPLFENAGNGDLTGTLTALRRLEPRANYTLSDIAKLLDPSSRIITVTAATASQAGS